MANLWDRVRIRSASSSVEAAQRGETPIGYKQDPLLGYNFRVSIDGLSLKYDPSAKQLTDIIGFSRITGIGSEIHTEKVRRGNSPVILEIPSTIENNVAEFSRGMAVDGAGQMLMKWYLDIRKILSGDWSDGVLSRAGNNNTQVIQKRDIIIRIPMDHRAFSPTSQVRKNRIIAGETVRFQPQPRMVTTSSGTEIPTVDIKLLGAWPKSLTLDDFDANQSKVLIQNVKMVYEGISYESTPKASGGDLPGTVVQSPVQV